MKKIISEFISCGNKPEVENDDLLPMDEWDGECWKTMFNFLAKVAPGVDPWDSLAAFIKLALMKGDTNG